MLKSLLREFSSVSSGLHLLLYTLCVDVHILEFLGNFRFLDTSLCDVDVQPTYVRSYIKGKVCFKPSCHFLQFSHYASS